MEAEAAPEVASAQLLLDFELAVLRALPGATSVADFPAGGVEKVKLNDPNSNGVRLKIGGRLIKQTFNANISDKIQAARVLKDRLKDDSFFGEAAVLAAEEQVRLDTQPSHQLSASSSSAELTEAELQWLAEWYDEQPEPDQVAIEQADAALQRHRASSGGSSATQVLFEAQWLRAKLTAATTRMQKAAREVERFKHEIDARQVEKRQRLDEPVRPPNWKEYKDYSQSTYQKLESEEQNRRAVPIDRSIFDHNLPSGDETRGWRRHWRRTVCQDACAAWQLARWVPSSLCSRHVRKTLTSWRRLAKHWASRPRWRPGMQRRASTLWVGYGATSLWLNGPRLRSSARMCMWCSVLLPHVVRKATQIPIA